MEINLFKYINVYVFMISLAIGCFAVYITDDSTRKVKVYPTDENYRLLQYRDSANNCFQLEQEEVECPTDQSKISKIPAQP